MIDLNLRQISLSRQYELIGLPRSSFYYTPTTETMDSIFCIYALQEAFKFGVPDIFNTDQGSQFTCKEFTKCIEERGVLISMDGKGRALDNVFVERLWRSK